MNTLNKNEFNSMLESLAQLKDSLIDEIKLTVRREGASRYLADLAVSLRQAEKTETHFLQLMLASRAVFSANVTVRSVGTPDDVELPNSNVG